MFFVQFSLPAVTELGGNVPQQGTPVDGSLFFLLLLPSADGLNFQGAGL